MLVVVALGLSRCPLSGLLLGGFDFSLGNSAVSEGEELSTSEAQYFDEGPVDMPVTLAKLDTPDIGSIDVTFTPSDGSSLNDLVRYATDADAADTEQVTGVYTINCRACVADVLSTPKFFIYNTTTDQEMVVDLDTDGSGEGKIDGSTEDTLILAGMSFLEDQISIPAFVAIDSNGLMTFTLTNSNFVFSDQNVMTDTQGNYYLSIANTNNNGNLTGTYDLIRRNLDGSQVQTLLSATTDEVHVIVTASGDTVTYMNQFGQIKMLVVDPIAASVAALTRGQPATLDGTNDSLVADTIILDDNGAQQLGRMPDELTEFKPINLLMNGEDLILKSQRRNHQTGEIIAFLGYVKTATLGYTPLLTPQQVSGVTAVDVGEKDRLYVFVVPLENQGIQRLYKLDISEANRQNAWAKAQILVDNWNIPVEALDVSDEGVIVFSGTNAYGEFQVYTLTSKGVRQINRTSIDSGRYVSARISKFGEFIIMCRKGPPGEKVASQFVFFRPDLDRTGEIHAFTHYSDESSCSDGKGSYYIDSDYLIHYYRSNLDSGAPQHAIIDPYDNVDLKTVLPTRDED